MSKNPPEWSKSDLRRVTGTTDVDTDAGRLARRKINNLLEDAHKHHKLGTPSQVDDVARDIRRVLQNNGFIASLTKVERYVEDAITDAR